MNSETRAFKQFQAIYPNDAACLAELMTTNYGGTEIVCPGCGIDSKFHRLSERRAFVCQYCGHHLPGRGPQLGVTYKCARRMARELRKLMASGDFGAPLGRDGKHGEIEQRFTNSYHQSNRDRPASRRHV